MDAEKISLIDNFSFVTIAFPTGYRLKTKIREHSGGEIAIRSFGESHPRRYKMTGSFSYMDFSSRRFTPFQDLTTPKEDFVRLAESYLHEMRTTKLQKIVINKIKSIPSLVHPDHLYECLAKLHPDSFVFHVRTLQDGEWIGASPELLVEKTGVAKWKTLALAATRDMRLGTPQWNKKEINEHQLVTQDITQNLDQSSIQYRTSEIYNRQAGRMIHRSQDIWLSSDYSTVQLAQILHPTSAICGLPRALAQETIQSADAPNRGLYTGYIAIDNSERSCAFVPLRCAQVVEGGYHLHLGAGMTLDSVPQAEWEETELKASTIINALNNAK